MTARDWLANRISRRKVLRVAGGSAVVTGAALSTAWGPSAPRARAQTKSPPLAEHPLVGAWLVSVPQGPDQPPLVNLTNYSADGTLLQAARTVQPAPPGLSFQLVYLTGGHGIWEPTSERGGRFTFVILNSNERGEYIGTTTVTGYSLVSDDGLTLSDDPEAPPVKRTIRGPDDTIVSEQFITGDGAQVRARRISFGE